PPASPRPSSASSAHASAPTQPTSRTSAPSRAAATAWLAPLPPGPREKAAPPTVSPARGSRSACTTRSRLIEPTTVRRGATGRAYPDVSSAPEPDRTSLVTVDDEAQRAENEATFREANER